MAWSISDLFPPWGDSGARPADNFNYQGGDQVNEKHLDYLWSSISTLENEVRSALTDLDSNGDGIVDEADTANLFKGNDIDSDGDGVVDKSETPLLASGTASGVNAFDGSPTDMPVALQAAKSDIVGGTIYVMGGLSGGSSSNDNLAYDPVSDTWTQKTAIPTARDQHSVVAADGSIYVMGGQNGTVGPMATNEAYDPGTDTWDTTVADLPATRRQHSADSYQGEIYIAGGYVGGTRSGSVISYDASTDSYTTGLTAMPTQRLATYNAIDEETGIWYIAGGNNSSSGTTAVHEAYHIGTDSWDTSVADMPAVDEDGGAAIYDGRLYAVGGVWGDTHSHYSYSIDGDNWRREQSLGAIYTSPPSDGQTCVATLEGVWVLGSGDDPGGVDLYRQATQVTTATQNAIVALRTGDGDLINLDGGAQGNSVAAINGDRIAVTENGSYEIYET